MSTEDPATPPPAAEGVASPRPTGGAALDQATFFRSCENGNLTVVSGLLRDEKVDVNAFNEEGVNALLLAVYQFERRQNTDLVTVLLEYGADPNEAMPPTADRRICIVKQQHLPQPPSGTPAAAAGASGTCAVGLGNVGSSLVSEQHSTRKITVAGKTPLLVALELKSSLYLKGWDYRHWDIMLSVLARATVNSLEEKLQGLPNPPPASHEDSVRAGVPPLLRDDSVSVPLLSAAGGDAARTAAVAAGWAAVFQSGKHEVLEVRAEGKHVEVLKELLVTNSKVLRNIVDAAAMQGHKGHVELKEASFTVVKEILAYLYSGHLDPNFVRMRGVDLLLAAHKYRIWPLKDACVNDIEANADNWNRLMSVALEVNAPLLVLKCAKSICESIEKASWRARSEKHVYASTMTPPAGGLMVSPQEV